MCVRSAWRDDEPYSESEPSDGCCTATDAPRAGGRPPGNAALAGTFFAPSGTRSEKDLTIQHTKTEGRMVDKSPFFADDSGRSPSSFSLISQLHLT